MKVPDMLPLDRPLRRMPSRVVLSDDGWLEAQPRAGRPYIRWAQAALNRLIGARLVEDGIAGGRTRAAIRSFQTRKGLTADGIAGPRTDAAIRAALAGRPPQGPAVRADQGIP